MEKDEEQRSKDEILEVDNTTLEETEEENSLNESPEQEKSLGYRILKEIYSYAICIAVAIVLSFLILTFVAQKTEVSGDSMKNTLYDGQQLIIDKLTYDFSNPDRYDIVVFKPKCEPDAHYVKRVIGLPGETVQIKDGYIYINEKILKSDVYGKEVIAPEYYGRADQPVTLGKDEYFLMGDNRNDSKDSRYEEVGSVKKSDLTGRVVLRVWPLSEFGSMKDK